MKIKTITCHNVYNVGASLQSYALSNYLTSLGHEVEIIDYQPLYLQKYSLKKVSNSRYNRPFLKQLYLLLKVPERLYARNSKSKKEFDKFTEKYLNLSKRRYINFEDLCKNPPKADIFIAGSDQIWNTFFENGRDPSFYLQFVPNSAIKASYAASFATQYIEEGYQQKVKQWISDLDYISVRESSGISILETLGISDGKLVLDPVFLLDKLEWEKLIDKTPVDEKYVFVYDFEQNKEMADFARSLAEENNWKVYSFLENSWCDKTFKEEGPLKFLSLIYQAEYVISNSFHATVFSIIFNKAFAVYNRQEQINTRMQDLLKLVGLKEKNDQINYDYVNKVIERAVKESKQYLSDVIETAKKRDNRQ